MVCACIVRSPGIIWSNVLCWCLRLVVIVCLSYGLDSFFLWRLDVGERGLSSIPVAYVVRGLYFVAGRRSVASRDRPSPRCAVYFLCLPVDDAPHAWFILILVS